MRPLGTYLRQMRRPAQAMALGLGVVTSIWAGILSVTSPSAVHVGMFILLLLGTALQLPQVLRFRRRKTLPTASFAQTSRLGATKPASTERPESRPQIEAEPREVMGSSGNWLKEQIEWPLFNIKQLLDQSPDREVLEWLPTEVERLLERIEQFRQDETGRRLEGRRRFPLTELLEMVVSGQQAMLRARDQRIDVQLGHRRDLVCCRRELVFDAVATLLAEACCQLSSGITMNIRTKEISGRIGVVVFAKNTESTIRPVVVERARRTLAMEGAELWEDVDGHWGFGFSLPLAPKKRKRQTHDPSSSSKARDRAPSRHATRPAVAEAAA